MAGIGDEVMTRQNDYDLGVVNRQRFRVIGTGEDGALSVHGADGQVRELPPSYAEEHVQLAYGSTVHAAQGATLDRGYLVTDGRSDAAALYVALTRGRERNTAFVALQATNADAADMTEDAAPRPTARSVLEGGLERDDVSRARARRGRAGRRPRGVHAHRHRTDELYAEEALRARMEGDLDQLVADGVLSAEDRARLAADQSSEHLSRVLRAGEQAGLDPQQLLRDAIAARSLDDAQSLAQVLSHRITSAHDLTTAQPHGTAPGRLPADHAEAIEHCTSSPPTGRANSGRRSPSSSRRGQPSTSARSPPTRRAARMGGQGRALAAYREAAGFEDTARRCRARPA